MDCSGIGREVGNEIVNRSKCLLDGLIQGFSTFDFLREDTSIFIDWGQGFPEELVVEVATTVELNGLRDIDEALSISAIHCSIGFLIKSIQIIDVSSMVLSVMVFHQIFGDNRFQSIDWVWQRLLFNFGNNGSAHFRSISDGTLSASFQFL